MLISSRCTSFFLFLLFISNSIDLNSCVGFHTTQNEVKTKSISNETTSQHKPLRPIKGIRLNWKGIRTLDTTKTRPKKREEKHKNHTNYIESQKNTGEA